MKVYFGAGIQGAENSEQRSERAKLYRQIIEAITSLGHEVIFEHTATNNKEEVWAILEKQFGALPKDPDERKAFIRNKNIEAIEQQAEAAVFEVSTPSLGVGIELAHAYLRPRMGLKAIPILCLYQKGFWGHGLSVMVSGVEKELKDTLVVREYSDSSEISTIASRFFDDLPRMEREKGIVGTLPEIIRKKVGLTLGAFCEKRVPAHVRDKIRLIHTIRGNSVTLIEERPNFQDKSKWTQTPVAQFRFDFEEKKWSLFYSDRNSKWHRYDGTDPTTSIETLIFEVDRDPTGIFWG